jgi:hypothetical protein
LTYDELPKEMLIMVVKDEDKDFAVTTIMEAAEPSRTVYSATEKSSSLRSTSLHHQPRYQDYKQPNHSKYEMSMMK